MKTCIMVDSACDLPSSFLRKHDLRILPISLKFGDRLFEDRREFQQTLEFYDLYLSNRSMDASTQPFEADKISSLLLNELVATHDAVIIITMTRTRSKIYNNAISAADRVTKLISKTNTNNFKRLSDIRVIDSKTMFTGQAILAYYAVSLAASGSTSVEAINHAVRGLRKHIRAYLVPNDIFYMRHRATKRGEKSVSKFAYFMADKLDIIPVVQMYRGESTPLLKVRRFDNAVEKLLQHVRKDIDKGLKTKIITMSYAGDPKEIIAKPAMEEFKAYANQRNVKIFITVMSTAAGINVGPGAFSLAYAA